MRAKFPGHSTYLLCKQYIPAELKKVTFFWIKHESLVVFPIFTVSPVDSIMGDENPLYRLFGCLELMVLWFCTSTAASRNSQIEKKLDYQDGSWMKINQSLWNIVYRAQRQKIWRRVFEWKSTLWWNIVHWAQRRKIWPLQTIYFVHTLKNCFKRVIIIITTANQCSIGNREYPDET